MTDLAPDHDLLVAVKAALLADATIASLVGGRVFDRPPERQDGSADVATPYISFGSTDEVPADVDCIDGVEITIQVDVWSSGNDLAYSSAECRTISERVRRVLHDAELVLETNALASLNYTLKRILRDPDGVTHHGVVQFTAVVETP